MTGAKPHELSNCYTVLLTIWQTLDLNTRTYVQQPDTSDTLATYMKVVRDTTLLLLSFINRFPSRQECLNIPKYNKRPERKQDQP